MNVPTLDIPPIEVERCNIPNAAQRNIIAKRRWLGYRALKIPGVICNA